MIMLERVKSYDDGYYWEIIEDYPYEKVTGFEGNYYENYYDETPKFYTLFNNKDEIQCLVLVVKKNIITNVKSPNKDEIFPDSSCNPYILDLFNNSNLKTYNHATFNLLGFVNVNGKLWYAEDFENYSDELIIYEDLDLKMSHIENLPENLIVQGNLIATNSHLKTLPDNLIVNGDLQIQLTYVTTIPKSIRVAGDIEAAKSNLEHIPDDFTVNGTLDVTRTRIKKLPENLLVKKNLYLGWLGEMEIPDSLVVMNDVVIFGNTSTVISPNVKIYGSIYYR